MERSRELRFSWMCPLSLARPCSILFGNHLRLPAQQGLVDTDISLAYGRTPGYWPRSAIRFDGRHRTFPP